MSTIKFFLVLLDIFGFFWVLLSTSEYVSGQEFLRKWSENVKKWSEMIRILSKIDKQTKKRGKQHFVNFQPERRRREGL